MFAATRSGTAWNVAFPNMTHSLIAAVPQSNANTTSPLQFLLLATTTTQPQGWYLLSTDTLFSPLQSTFLGSAPSSDAVALSLSSGIEESVFTVLLWNSDASYQIYHFNAMAQKIVASSHGQWAPASPVQFSSASLVSGSQAEGSGSVRVVIGSIGTGTLRSTFL